MSDIRLLRTIGWIEWVSFILLLFVAMPLKYIWDMPLGVQIVGPIHGVLFMAFVAYLGKVAITRSWRTALISKCVAGSLTPLGPFLYEQELKQMKPLEEI